MWIDGRDRIARVTWELAQVSAEGGFPDSLRGSGVQPEASGLHRGRRWGNRPAFLAASGARPRRVLAFELF